MPDDGSRYRIDEQIYTYEQLRVGNRSGGCRPPARFEKDHHMDLLRNTSSGEVFTRDELRARLTAELDAMDPETRAANCDGTVDDLIIDSVLVGIYQRDDGDEGEEG
jgi:hypothetical protein